MKTRALPWFAGTCSLALTLASLSASEILESARQLPVLQEVDVVVVGGSSAGVAAAVEAARSGAKVFLAAPRPYLGEDVCATYRLWLEPGETPTTDLARQVFEVEGETEAASPLLASDAPRAVKPLQVKRVLDQALLQAGVPFLYNCPATEILTDANGYPAGVVVANRSGRQAVLAKVIIDATEHASVARLAKAVFREDPAADRHTFSRVVVGGPPRRRDTVTVRERKTPFMIRDRAEVPHPVLEYQLRLPLKDASFAAWAAAEQLARDWTWSPQAVDASEVLFHLPAEAMQGKQTQAGNWPGADRVPLDVFRPAELDQLFVLGGCADVSGQAAAELVRPVNAMAVGARVGAKAAEVARTVAPPAGVRLARQPVAQAVSGDVVEVPVAANPRAGSRFIPAEPHGLPVLGEYDVVVVGGGTGGAPAGIGAG